MTQSSGTKELVDMTLAKLDVPIAALYSTLGRTAARTLETRIIADMMPGMYDALVANIRAGETKTFNEGSWEPARWPAQAKGVGYMEAPRGGPAHFIEAALAGHRLAVANQPLEILRTIHSFDPCLACAVHVVDPEKGELVQVTVTGGQG